MTEILVSHRFGTTTQVQTRCFPSPFVKIGFEVYLSKVSKVQLILLEADAGHSPVTSNTEFKAACRV